jgi:uncharacterized membrane protein
LQGHLTNPLNLILVSPVSHFLIHVALSALFDDQPLHTTTTAMSNGWGHVWTSATYEQVL